MFYYHQWWLVLVFNWNVCARYRDLNPTIASLVTLSFFLTQHLEPYLFRTDIYPAVQSFFHFVESIRTTLGQPVSSETWWILTSITILGWILVIPAVSKMCRKLVYWL